jgi:hypothetical protein
VIDEGQGLFFSGMECRAGPGEPQHRECEDHDKNCATTFSHANLPLFMISANDPDILLLIEGHNT